MTPEQGALVRTHVSLADEIPRRMLCRSHRWYRDDARSWALEGLVDAARTYDPRRGVPFRVFALMKMRWFVLHGLRSERTYLAHINLDDSEDERERAAERTGHSPVIHPVLEDQITDNHDQRAVWKLVGALCADLPLRVRDVIYAHYYEGTELKGIAKASGRSYATVRRRHTVGLRLLKTRLQGQGLPAGLPADVPAFM